MVDTMVAAEPRRLQRFPGSDEEALLTILNGIGDAIIATDADGRVVRMNRAAVSLTGWTGADAHGRDLCDVFHAIDLETRARMPDSTERILRSGLVIRPTDHVVLIVGDGRELPIAGRASPLRADDGKLLGLVLAFRDTSDERHAEGVASRSQRELRQIVEEIPDGVLIQRGRLVVYANPAMAAFLGYESPATLVGMSTTGLLHPEDAERPLAVQRRTEEHTAMPLSQEWRFRSRTGGLVELEASGGRIVEFDGESAILWVLRNISERKKLQAQLMRADRMVSVGTLAAGVAHEINNPLAYLMTNLAFAAREVESLVSELPVGRLDEVLDAFKQMQEGAERVRHTVRDLKTFSRPDEERSGPVDVRRVLESSINMSFNEIRHRARLVKDYGQMPLVEGNEARLGQVFLNLLVNAAHAIPEGAADRNEIRLVTTTHSSGQLLVEVRDTGSGMPPDVVARIFDPFFTTKPIGVGTGLGLTICQNIVHALGGEITVASAVGKGSVFRVMLPPAKYSGETIKPGAQPAAARHRARILVVDDEPSMGLSIRRALAPEHEVTAVTSARAALERLEHGESFDLIISDLMMPEMTGMDLFAELARVAPSLAERTIFLTGGAFTPKAREFLDRVPNPRVEKPFEVQSLIALIRSLAR
jgi:PAS domain S-box-containing protein